MNVFEFVVARAMNEAGCVVPEDYPVRDIPLRPRKEWPPLWKLDELQAVPK